MLLFLNWSELKFNCLIIFIGSRIGWNNKHKGTVKKQNNLVEVLTLCYSMVDGTRCQMSWKLYIILTELFHNSLEHKNW